MPTETAPPPSAPSPNAAAALKPTATAAPPATAKPDHKPTAAPAAEESHDENPFASLDERMAGKKVKEEKPVETEESDDADLAEPDAKVDDKVKPAEDKGTKPLKAKLPLREAIEKANGDLKKAQDTIAEREARIVELESKGGETTTLSQRLAAVEKERDEALSQVRGLRQESSPEFKEKFDKPFERAAADAKRFIEQVPVSLEDGTTRKASWEGDFARIYGLPEVEAWDQAEALFGKRANLVMAKYDELHRLNRQRTEAAETERAQWKQTEQQREAQAIQQREAATVAVSKADQYLIEKYPDLYAEDPKDPEGNALMKEWDQKFAATPKTMAEWAHQRARMRNNARAFPRLAIKYKAAIDRIAELEAAGKSADDTEPGKTRRSSAPPPPAPEDDFKAGLKKLA